MNSKVMTLNSSFLRRAGPQALSVAEEQDTIHFYHLIVLVIIIVVYRSFVLFIHQIRTMQFQCNL